MWERSKEQEVWDLTSIVFGTQGVRYLEFVDLVWYMLFVQHAGDNTMEMIFMVAWCMWHNRNAVRYESARQSAPMVMQKTRTMLAEFLVANHVIAQPKIELNDSWSLPTFPNYKVNVDGQFLLKFRGSGVRVVIRDDEGRVTVALSKKLFQALSLL